MKFLKLLSLLFLFTSVNLFSATLLDSEYKTNQILKRATITIPDNLSKTEVTRFEESANVSIWKDETTSKIYIRVEPITDNIFIAYNTHIIKQLDTEGVEQTYTLTLLDSDTSNAYFDYVYKDAPKTFEVNINSNQDFNNEKSFNFLFESTQSIELVQNWYTDYECANIEMKTGWSLVSLPVAVTLQENSSDPDTDLSKLGAYTKLYTFVNNAWVENPTSITAGQGFWIKKDTDETVELCGSPYNPILDELENGWHLVGTGQTLYNLDQIDYIYYSYKYKNSSWSENITEVLPGEGVWVKIGDGESIELPAIPTNLQKEFTKNSESLSLTSNEISVIKDYEYSILNAQLSNYTQYLNKALFIADTFEGIIDSMEQNGNNILVKTIDSNQFEQVYSKYKFSFDGVEASTARSIKKEQKIYDYLNKQPITVNFTNKEKIDSRGIKSTVPYIKLDVPNSYRFDPETTIDSRAKLKTIIPIALSAGPFSISFENESGWSTVEFEVTPKFDFDFDLISFNPYLSYNSEITTGHSEDMKLTIAGSIEGKLFDKDFPLLRQPIDLTIYPGFVIKVLPQIGVNVSGSITGKYALAYTNSYTETNSFSFDTRLDPKMNVSSSSSPENPAPKFSHEIAAEANASISASPKLTFMPALGVSKLSVKLNLFKAEAGYKFAGSATGQFSLKEDQKFSKIYYMHDFFPAYADISASGEAFLSGEFDLSNIPLLNTEKEEFSWTPFLTQDFGKVDFAWLPKPVVTETTTETDALKRIEITLPEGGSDYLNKVKLYFNGSELYLDAQGVGVVKDMQPNSTNTIEMTWVNGETSDNDHAKSFVLANSVEFTTSSYCTAENPCEDTTEETTEDTNNEAIQNIVGEWTLNFRCVGESTDASVFPINIAANSTTFSVVSIAGSGSGTDYDGDSLSHTVSGTVDKTTKNAEILINTSFGTSSNRIDTYSTNLDTNDTGYISTSHYFTGYGSSGCNAEVRLNK